MMLALRSRRAALLVRSPLLIMTRMRCTGFDGPSVKLFRHASRNGDHSKTGDDSAGIVAVWVLAGATPRPEASVTASSPVSATAAPLHITADRMGRAILCDYHRNRPVQLTVGVKNGVSRSLTVQTRKDRSVTLVVVQIDSSDGRYR